MCKMKTVSFKKKLSKLLKKEELRMKKREIVTIMISLVDATFKTRLLNGLSQHVNGCSGELEEWGI